MHVPDDKQPCSRPCGSSVGRHLKTLDSISARHWTLSLRAEPNGLPTNDMAKSEKEVPSTAGERARHEAQAGSQPRKSPFHRDKWPWSVVAVLLPRPIRVWKQVTDQHIELIGPVARANLVGVHYHHVPCVPLQPIDGGTETTGTMRLLAHRVVPSSATAGYDRARDSRRDLGWVYNLGRATQQIQTTFSPQTIPRC